MHSVFRFIVLLSCAGMVASPAMAAAQDHSHHAAPTTTVPVPAPAQRWATDAHLRNGMADVRNGVEALEHAKHGHMGPAQVAALAKAIEGYIGGMVANCKLEPEADMALHGIIGKLLHGTATLKKGTLDTVAIASMQQALTEYPRLFDDPDWRAAAAASH